MSKAFTREDDDSLEDVLQVDDTALPPGETNYVTPAGAERLRRDIEKLRTASHGGDTRRRLAIEGRLAALLRRLEAAEIVDPRAQPAGQVVFGSTVTVRREDGEERRYRIVGIDEADARRGWVSWRTPVARALIGLRAGETATLRAPGGEEELAVIEITSEASEASEEG